LKRIALADPAKAFGPDGSLLELKAMPEDIRRAISTIELGKDVKACRLRFYSKTDALQVLAKHLGMLVDRREVKSDGAPLFSISRPVLPQTRRKKLSTVR